ncbi:nuclear transport factor 2 family protein [Dyadobacter sp. LJ53]|uniref:nuclear transport factor 2 family protein n=1 Tax=Dyadobacter chenwenxiniae TaxID=2906456 RepID=UPI001F39DFDE|nr:nuclear transport factor 2 family protein [Dyadobacter chenwenxiniae]MCF0051961.1 nuclear transport factor 2 family protein [Dyadobacter chenwenxiniae]
MEITTITARSFAEEWIGAWNSHDLASVMQHYAADIEFYSPFIKRLEMNDEGFIHGRDVLETYFAKALAVYPDLHFELHETLTGANSVVLYYTSVNNKKAAELMQFDAFGKINLVKAHYND